jgi:hypothetical protein
LDKKQISNLGFSRLQIVLYLIEHNHSCSIPGKYVYFSNSVEIISNFSFEGCSSLSGLIFPQSLRVIGESSFCSCHNLTEFLKIAKNVTEIGASAFGRASLDSLFSFLTESLAHIQKYTFLDCSSLHSVSFSSSILSIGEKALYCCQSLEELILPQASDSIDSAAFSFCHLLRCSPLFPEMHSSLSAEAFSSCSSIASIVFQGDLLETIDFSVFRACNALQSIFFADSTEEMFFDAFS